MKKTMVSDSGSLNVEEDINGKQRVFIGGGFMVSRGCEVVTLCIMY